MSLTKLQNAPKRNKTGASITRKMIAVCILSLSGGPLFAQQGFDLGLRGIVQTSSLLNATDQAAGAELNYKNKVSVGGGIGAGYNFNNHVGVGLDVLYSKQGQGYVGDAGQVTAVTGNGSVHILSQEFALLASVNNIPFNTNYTARIEMSCMKIPIMFRYTGDATKPWYFSSFIGPQINILSSTLVQVNGQTASFSAFNIKPEDLYNKTTFDAVLGLGVGINLSDNLLLSVHLRLDYGLSDAEKKSVNVAGSKWWEGSRASTNNATGGGLISLNYRFTKKAKTKTVTTSTKTKTKTKK